MNKQITKPNQSIVTARLVGHYKGRYLIAQRKGGSQNGLWEFPGGKLDSADFRRASSLKVSAYAVAACREFEEEIGYGVSPAIVGHFVTYDRRIHIDGMEQNAHAALVDFPDEPPLNKFCRSEVLRVDFVPLEDILELMEWGEFRPEMISIPARLGLVTAAAAVSVA